jgi:flagellar biosynthesis protein FliQ
MTPENVMDLAHRHSLLVTAMIAAPLLIVSRSSDS